jgi:hypothetical protein
MKLAKRLIALLLACLMFGGVAAMAADEAVQDYAFTEEELAKIYDPARYEAKDYLPGRLIVGVTKNIPADKTYADLFPEYTIDERYTKEYETITVFHFKLSENTQDAVVAAVGALRSNPYVIYAEPYFVRQEKQTLIGDKPVGEPEEVTFTVTHERLEEIYDPANYTQREYKPGVVQVYFNRAVSGVRTYEELFPELEIDKIEYVYNGIRFTNLTISLKETTTEAGVQAIGLLKESTALAYVEPAYLSGFFMDGVVLGDVDRNGIVENPDLILTAKYVVQLVDFSEEEKYCADITGDGDVNNADIICSAQTIVGIVPQAKPMLSETRAWEISQALVNKVGTGISRMNYLGKYNDFDVAVISLYAMSPAAILHIQVAGYDFYFADYGTGLYLFKGNECMRIDEAYESGWVTAEDVAAIWAKGGPETVYHKWIGDSYANPIVDEYYPSRGFSSR